MNKPPCFMCNGESVAWITLDGRRRRVCSVCAVILSRAAFGQGADLVVVGPERGKATVFEHGEVNDR